MMINESGGLVRANLFLYELQRSFQIFSPHTQQPLASGSRFNELENCDPGIYIAS